MKLLVRLASLLLFASSWLTAQVAVTTYQYDNYRSGANTHETILTPSNVNPSQFGRKRVFPVTGYVYAQPLYVHGVMINGVSHNVVYIATEQIGSTRLTWIAVSNCGPGICLSARARRISLPRFPAGMCNVTIWFRRLESREPPSSIPL